jgi:hypothetical protein
MANTNMSPLRPLPARNGTQDTEPTLFWQRYQQLKDLESQKDQIMEVRSSPVFDLSTQVTPCNYWRAKFNDLHGIHDLRHGFCALACSFGASISPWSIQDFFSRYETARKELIEGYSQYDIFKKATVRLPTVTPSCFASNPVPER